MKLGETSDAPLKEYNLRRAAFGASHANRPPTFRVPVAATAKDTPLQSGVVRPRSDEKSDQENCPPPKKKAAVQEHPISEEPVTSTPEVVGID